MKLGKLAISAALVSVLGYIAGMYNMVAVLLLFALVMLMDTDVVAKKNVTQAAVLSLFFTVFVELFAVLGKTYISFLDMILADAIANYRVMQILYVVNLGTWAKGILLILEFAVIIYAVIVSFKGKVVKIPLITGLVNKHFDGAKAKEAEAPKAEAPKAEAPKAEAPKAEAPKAEAPKAEAPKAEAPKAEAPAQPAPQVSEETTVLTSNLKQQ